MTFFRSMAFFLPAVCLLAQTPPPKPSQTPSKPADSAKPPAAVPAPAPAPPALGPDDVVASLGTTKITLSQYEHILDSLPQNYQQAARGPQKRQFGDLLARLLVLAAEGRKKGVDQTPAFKVQADFVQQDLLARMTAEQMMKDLPISEADVRKYYDEHKAEFESMHARHILIRTKGSPMPLAAGKKELTEEEGLAKIQELHNKLVAGGDFEALAKAESDDTGSGANGGDLGTFRHGQMVAPFEQAAFALKPGEISGPVKTQFGYHLIKAETHELKPFEEVRPDLEKRMRPEQTQKVIEDMITNSGVKLNPDFFGPSPAPAAPPAPASAPPAK